MRQNVLEWLETVCEAYADKTAFSDENGAVTFAQTRARAQAVGTAIAEKTIVRKPIAVLSGRHCLTPASFLGVVYSGCFYAPIDASLPLSRINQILEILQPALVLTDAQNASLVQKTDYAGEVLFVEEAVKTPADMQRLSQIRRDSTADDPLYVIFTSGSTGRPKGVITSHFSLMSYIDAYADVMQISDADVLGNQSPLDYIAAIRDIYLPLRCGCSTVIIPKTLFMTPALLFDYMNANRITAVGWSASALTVIVALQGFDSGKPEYLRKVCFSGSVMPCKCLRVWQDNLPDTLFINQYGPTEATASCTYYIVPGKVRPEDVLPIGRAYANYRILLLTEDGQPAADGAEGEICVAGPCLALGYYNAPELTTKSFVQNPLHNAYRDLIYHTGDIGLRRADGTLEFHGRRDRQIKHLGHRVELDEVEAAAASTDGVQECSVLYDYGTETICLFYTGSAGMRDIAVHMRQTLPGFMIPRKIRCLDSLPKLPNGKTDLSALKSMI
ncbi:MAG: amino acid adenylation domain-containing protein [Clostridia bacterium]|nr:amino acid adenylation domain-containing protein [Clostridia bacterium]